MSTDELVRVLEDMGRRARSGVSLAGSLEYVRVVGTEGALEWEVTGSYEVNDKHQVVLPATFGDRR